MEVLSCKILLYNKYTVHLRQATGMVIKAKELSDKHGWFFTNQFENESNAWIHEQTTGPEIVQAFQAEHQKLDHVVMAYGTGGTVLGCSRYFRQHSPETQIHLCEPSNSPMMYSGIRTQYPEDGQPSTSFDTAHPVWRPHLFQYVF